MLKKLLSYLYYEVVLDPEALQKDVECNFVFLFFALFHI